VWWVMFIIHAIFDDLTESPHLRRSE
jgi:hypothetical protein